jgi:hypothetical protein
MSFLIRSVWFCFVSIHFGNFFESCFFFQFCSFIPFPVLFKIPFLVSFFVLFAFSVYHLVLCWPVHFVITFGVPSHQIFPVWHYYLLFSLSIFMHFFLLDLPCIVVYFLPWMCVPSQSLCFFVPRIVSVLFCAFLWMFMHLPLILLSIFFPLCLIVLLH